MSKAHINVKDYLSKLILLENVVGATTKYQIFTPFSLNSHNPIELQKAARNLASFIGLERFSFVVAIAKQKQNIGGHIELQNDGNDVFIEISEQSANFSAAVLATLAHELTHKYLHVRRLSCGNPIENEYENEILTDITAVYLGFGKLMLNGSECERKWEEKTHKGTVSNTESLNSGYLSLKQFAFVYYLVCRMRKIGKSECLSGLTEKAEQSVKECFAIYGDYFKAEIYDLEETFRLKKLLENELQPAKELLIKLEKQISQAKQIIEINFDKFFNESQKQINRVQQDTFKQIDKDVYNPCLKFLLSAKCEEEINEFSSKVREIEAKAENRSKSLSSIIQMFGNGNNTAKAEFDSFEKYAGNQSIWSKMWSRKENKNE